MKKNIFSIVFNCFYILSVAQVSAPNPLPIKSFTYLDKTKKSIVYDFKTFEKKAFLFYDVKTEPLAEVMYNGSDFVFEKTKITIFPIYFSGQLSKKNEIHFNSAIPTQLYRTPVNSIFSTFNLTESDLPILVVYDEKNILCGFAKRPEEIAAIYCDGKIIKPRSLKLQILSEQKDKQLLPYSYKEVFILSSKTNDTIAKLKTDQYGNFNTELPKVDNDYLITTNEKNPDVTFVLLSSQTGEKIGSFKSTDKGFEYKLLQLELSSEDNLYAEDDIELKFNKLKKKSSSDIVIFENLFYEKGETKPSPSSKELLDKLKKVLMEYPQFDLLVISHTDSQGEDDKNLKLSNERSEEVINYLKKQGIKKKRLKGEGKGEKEIRNRCLNNVDCSDKEHEYNRRTEFVFIKKGE